MNAAIDQIIVNAIEQRIFPGAVVRIVQSGRTRYANAYGSTMYTDPGDQPVTLDTIYDIASLTKVFTATAALRLLDAGELKLDAAVMSYLPDLQTRDVTLRQLFTHTSGLNLRLSALRDRGAAGLRATVYAATPTRPPGTFTAYTNINSLLLGEVVARVYGKPLDSAIHEMILAPLEIHETGFRPSADMKSRIAPTEWDAEWRGGLVHGSVHDESAHTLGGVAGHAGMFSTAADLECFTQLWLNGGAYAGQQLLREETVARATRDYTAHLEAEPGHPLPSGLGWMIDRLNFMGPAPAGTYGHTGFTGPALVIAPHAQIAIILLNNRTYPRRTPPPYRHHAVTAAVVQAAIA